MGVYSRNNNFRPQGYSQYSNVVQNPPAFNCAAHQLIALPIEYSCQMTPIPSPTTSEHSGFF
jgi:hypothetical protein